METRLNKIKLLALDVDGVLTDGTICIGNTGELFKGFNAKDGLGINVAIKNGLEIAIITGRKSEIIHRRAEELELRYLCEGIKDKYQELQLLGQKLKLEKENIAYMGDDLNDLPAFQAAGFCFAPADGVAEIQAEADIVVSKPGGRGAVREAIELILKAQGKWENIIAARKKCGQGDNQ